MEETGEPTQEQVEKHTIDLTPQPYEMTIMMARFINGAISQLPFADPLEHVHPQDRDRAIGRLTKPQREKANVYSLLRNTEKELLREAHWFARWGLIWPKKRTDAPIPALQAALEWADTQAKWELDAVDAEQKATADKRLAQAINEWADNIAKGEEDA